MSTGIKNIKHKKMSRAYVYKCTVAVLLLIVNVRAIAADYESVTDTANWSSNATWVGTNAPSYTLDGSSNNYRTIDINGFIITSPNSVVTLSEFSTLTIKSGATLVIDGDLNERSGGWGLDYYGNNVVVEEGGTLVVLGDINWEEDVASDYYYNWIRNHGTIIVMNDADMTGADNNTADNGDYYVAGNWTEGGWNSLTDEDVNEGDVQALVDNNAQIIEFLLEYDYDTYSYLVGYLPQRPVVYAIANGQWSDTGIWSRDGTHSCSCIPAVGDTVIIDGYAVELDMDATVASLVMRAAAGSVFTLKNAVRFTVSNTLKLDNTIGLAAVKFEQNGTSTVSAGTVIIAGDDNVLIELNDASVFSVVNNFDFISGGRLEINDASWFNYMPYANTFFGNGNSLAINISYQNISINDGNTYYVDGNLLVTGVLELLDGYIITGNGDSVTVAESATITGGSDESFVDGPINRYVSTTDATIFPTGDFDSEGSPVYAPISIELENAGLSYYRAEYFYKSPDNQVLLDANTPELVKISEVEKWDIHKCVLGGLSNENAYVTLYFLDNMRSIVSNPSQLLFAHWTGSSWESLGQTAFSDSSVRSGLMTSFSDVTIGASDVDALPVELLSFEGSFANGNVLLQWVTATEKNNDFFAVEKSADGIAFELYAVVAGSGTVSSKNAYQVYDSSPFAGITYYRFKQVDYDGAFSYSPVIAVMTEANEDIAVHFYPSVIDRGDNLHLHLQNVDPHALVDVSIYNSMGQMVYAKNIAEGVHNTVILIPDTWQSSTYFIKCTVGGSEIQKNLIVR